MPRLGRVQYEQVAWAVTRAAPGGLVSPLVPSRTRLVPAPVLGRLRNSTEEWR